MLETLTLINFQSHKKTKLEFSPYVTTIWGRNDLGKSAIIRILNWIGMNNLSGEEFFRWGSQVVKGVLEVDGQTIIRKKTKSGLNLYYLDDKRLKSFGNKTVPDPVANLLNICEMNFQMQHDLPFWFCRTPGQISKELNKIVNLSQIDSTLSNLSMELKERKTHVKLISNKIKETKEEKKSLQWAVAADEKLRRIEKLKKKIDGQAVDSEILDARIKTVQSLQKEIKRWDEAISLLHQTVKQEKQTTKLHQEVNYLIWAIGRIKSQKELSQLEIPELYDKKVEQEVSQLRYLLFQYNEAKEKKCQLELEIKSVNEKIQMMKKNYKQKRCPVCKQIIQE